MINLQVDFFAEGFEPSKSVLKTDCLTISVLESVAEISLKSTGLTFGFLQMKIKVVAETILKLKLNYTTGYLLSALTN
jgi:hypothetical protein